MPLQPYPDFKQDPFYWSAMVVPPYWDQNTFSPNQTYLDLVPRPTIPIPRRHEWSVRSTSQGKWCPLIIYELAAFLQSCTQSHIDSIAQVIHTTLAHFKHSILTKSSDIAVNELRQHHPTVRQAYHFIVDPYLKLYIRALRNFFPSGNITVPIESMRYDVGATISGLIKYRAAWIWVMKLIKGYAAFGAGSYAWISIVLIGCLLYFISFKPQDPNESSQAPLYACSPNYKTLPQPSKTPQVLTISQDQIQTASHRLPPSTQPDLGPRLVPLNPQQIVLQYCHPSTSHWPNHFIQAFQNASTSTQQKARVVLDRAAVKEDLKVGRVILEREGRERGWEWEGVQWI